MTGTLLFDPLVPLWVIAVIGVASAAAVGLGLWRSPKGAILRALAALAILGAMLNPSYQQEQREPLADIVIAIVDDSASQKIADRPAQTEAAFAALTASVAALPNTELRVVRFGDGEGDSGSLAMTALANALADEPAGRIAGVVMISDGRIHDIERLPPLPAPMHLLLSGHSTDWDRRLVVRNAPAFAILGEPVTLTLRIEDQGDAPQGDLTAPLAISIDGAAPLLFDLPIGQDVDLPITLDHGGMNVLQFSTPMAAMELTDRNNSAVVQINGVRDRLRVLLVSGEPYPGERTWRNLLKSDSAVDLVHFTILRPPEKQDGVPVDELALIAFPTRELFLEKIDDFDLIIFDRYERRGILPDAYFQNIADYVRRGGGLLVASGPEYGSADSIYRSSLGAVLPGIPTARVVERAFQPQISDLGSRHPVSEGLDDYAGEWPPETEGGPTWGRWLRQIDVTPAPSATAVLNGQDDRPLLLLDRVGDGRVALLTSDQAWLWDRGYEGGGPQLELLRRLAHWLMKEPELEEESLWAEPTGQTLRIIRRTLEESIGDVTVTLPDGSTQTVTLSQVSPGRYETLWTGPQIGFYRLAEGDLTAVIALGPAAPKEFEQTIATGEVLDQAVSDTLGGIVAIEDGMPDIRAVRAGRPAAGRGWIGITPRGAYRTADVSTTSLIPAWLGLMVAALLILGAWLREGRRAR
jgi:hypothetical protein